MPRRKRKGGGLGSHEWRRRFAQSRRGTRRFTGRNPDVTLIPHSEEPRGKKIPGHYLTLCTRTKDSALAVRKQNGWKTAKVKRLRNKRGKVVHCIFQKE